MARVLISMKDEFLERIDEVAEYEHRSRSELIREALRTYITRRNNANAATTPTPAATQPTVTMQQPQSPSIEPDAP